MARKQHNNTDLCTSIVEAAERHGREESEMEVGDLQQALQIVWAILTPEQRQTAYNEIVDMCGWDEESA